LHILENLRFEPGEDAADLDYAKEVNFHNGGEVYVMIFVLNKGFYNPSFLHYFLMPWVFICPGSVKL